MYPEERPLFRLPGPFGAPIEIHGSLFLLGVLMLMLAGGRSPEALIHALIVLAMIVLSILLHELGHAWGAWVQGVPVHKVVLYGGGGLCYHGPASDRATELIVAMGPLTNLGLWALASLGAMYLRDLAFTDQGLDRDLLRQAHYLGVFARMNLFLFFLNLLPMQPLDGGRLLLLALLRMMPAQRATVAAGRIGLACCVVYPLAMVYALLTFGWMFLFVPSFGLHRAMARGERPG